MFKKILKFLLKHDPPKDAEDIAIYFFTPNSKDTEKRYYLKLIPCNNLGCFPEFGAMEEKDFQAFMNKSSDGGFAASQDDSKQTADHPDKLEQLLSDIRNNRHKKLMN